MSYDQLWQEATKLSLVETKPTDGDEVYIKSREMNLRLYI